MKKWFFVIALFVMGQQVSTAQSISYNSHVKPLFVSYGCTGCHGGTNNLFLDTYSQVFSTGNHNPVIVPGDTNSVLIKKIKGIADFGGRMPQGGEMTLADINTIVAWVKNGAIENSTTEVNTLEAGVLKTFELKQNYPNPFNPTTNITFAIPKQSLVTIKIFDILGREVATLLNEERKEGFYSVLFNGVKLSSGVYFYRMQSDNFSQTKKLLLQK
jgi:hypothetical protein